MTIIEKLVYLMEQTGETRTAVSEATGIPYNTIQNIFVRSSSDLRISTLIKLCDHFHVTLDSFARSDVDELEYTSGPYKKTLLSSSEQTLILTMRNSDPVTQDCVYRLLKIENDMPDEKGA